MKKTDDEIIETEDGEKKHGKAFVVIAILVAVVIVVLATVLFVMFFCNIENMKITGNTILVEEEIKQDILADEYDKNAVILTLKNKLKPRHDIPFVESMDISMTDLNSVTVKIKEKEIAGYIKGEGKERIYYDSSGIVQEISKVKVKGAPRVVPEGELSAVSVGEELPIREKSRRELLSLQRELQNNEIAVKKIAITEEGNFILTYKNITIRMGTSAYMPEKVIRLKYILPKVKKKTGILHLEDWTEGSTDIVFESTE